MRIKVCGITTLDDALLCRDLGVDFIGLIRADSPRAVPLKEAIRIINAVAEHLQPVLLYRDAPLETVVGEAQSAGARWIQLHGAESARFVSELRKSLPGVCIIRACEIPQNCEPDAAQQQFSAICDMIRPDVVILDRPKDQPADHHDDFRRLRTSRTLPTPAVWCAGGLRPDNVATAIAGSCFDGVDVARGVESAPGRKDARLLRDFLAAIRVNA